MGFSLKIVRWMALAIPVFYVGTADAKSNPFDETCAVIAQYADDSTAGCLTKGRPVLSYDYSYGSNSNDARLALDAIVKKMGDPISIRGTNYVWRLENPDNSVQQKKTVTIIFTYDPDGESKVMMDRVRPGSIVTYKKKVKASKPIKQKTNRPKKRSLKPDANKSDVF